MLFNKMNGSINVLKNCKWYYSHVNSVYSVFYKKLIHNVCSSGWPSLRTTPWRVSAWRRRNGTSWWSRTTSAGSCTASWTRVSYYQPGLAALIVGWNAGDSPHLILSCRCFSSLQATTCIMQAGSGCHSGKGMCLDLLELETNLL